MLWCVYGDKMAITHELTLADKQKGGQTISIYRQLSNSLRKRKHCSPKCFYFESCPLMSMSISSPDKKCMMKAFPERIRSRFTKVFLEGEDGMLAEIKGAIYQFGLQADTMGFKEKRDYIELMLKLHKAIYGDKTQVISDKEPLQINIQQLQQSEYPQLSSVAVGVLESKRSIALKEKIMSECLDVADVETDPESLFNSEKLNNIICRDERGK